MPLISDDEVRKELSNIPYKTQIDSYLAQQKLLERQIAQSNNYKPDVILAKWVAGALDPVNIIMPRAQLEFTQMPPKLIGSVYGIDIVFSLLIVMCLADKKWKSILNGWGRFFAISCIIAGITELVLALTSASYDGTGDMRGIFFVCLTLSGLLCLLRTRLGWLLSTILTFNPIVWAINIRYYMRRRNEWRSTSEMFRECKIKYWSKIKSKVNNICIYAVRKLKNIFKILLKL